MERVLSYEICSEITPLSSEELALVAGGDDPPCEPFWTFPYPTIDPSAPDRPPRPDGGGPDAD